MAVVQSLYFEKPGRANTAATIDCSVRRAADLGLRQVVVASSHGTTALAARVAFPAQVQVVAVSITEGFRDVGWCMSTDERRALEDAGIPVLTGLQALGDDVSEAMSGGAASPNRVVRETLYLFSQGMKVAVEVAVMAADAGLLDMTQDCIAIAGTDEGADTAIVITPAYARQFGRLRIREILAKPRG